MASPAAPRAASRGRGVSGTAAPSAGRPAPRLSFFCLRSQVFPSLLSSSFFSFLLFFSPPCGGSRDPASSLGNAGCHPKLAVPAAGRHIPSHPRPFSPLLLLLAPRGRGLSPRRLPLLRSLPRPLASRLCPAAAQRQQRRRRLQHPPAARRGGGGEAQPPLRGPAANPRPAPGQGGRSAGGARGRRLSSARRGSAPRRSSALKSGPASKLCRGFPSEKYKRT